MKKRIGLIITKFRLYPEKHSRLFCIVKVWRNKNEMIKYLKRTRGDKYAKENIDTEAIAFGRECYRVYPDGRKRKSGEFCEINVHQDNLDMEIISHEVTHATFRWADRTKLELNSKDGEKYCSDQEERFCYALGSMTLDFVKKLQQKRIEWKILL